MENQLTILAVVTIFILTYLFLYLFFRAQQKKQDLEIMMLMQQRGILDKQLQDSELNTTLEDSKGAKSKLVYEQTKKIEILELELARQKKRIHELKLVAQNASMAQQHFLSNVSSEIKRPVEAVLDFSEDLKKSTQDKTSLSLVQNITDASNQLLFILNDILNLSKMQAKTFEIEEKVVDVESFLSSLVARKQTIATQKSLLLSLEADQNLPNFLIFDSQKVENILENLIDNAIKYTKDGYVKVNVLVDRNSEKVNTVDISFYVEDTGVGISEEFQDKVFTIFERVDAKENENLHTAGLGLSIDKQIALLMNGDITFKSETSKGSVFRFSLRGLELPLWSKEDRVDDKNVDFAFIDESAKVMIIAEYNQNHQTIIDSFAQSQATLFSYSNLREAMQTLKGEEIDLIFIDVEILNNDEGAVSKVIANSTTADVVALVSSRVKEIDFSNSPLVLSGFLKKPLSKGELFQISMKLLNR